MTENPEIPISDEIDNNAEPDRALNVFDFKTKSILAEGVKADELVPLVEHPHWPDAKIPVGYRLSHNGVHKMLETGPSEAFSGPIYVLAQTLTPQGNDAGLVLEFEDRDGKFRQLVIPRTRLYEDAKILASDLSTLNFALTPGKEKDLLVFLSKIATPQTDIACAQTGWVESVDPTKLCFVFPSHSTDPQYHYQPERYSPAIESVQMKGTLREWNQHVYSAEPYPLFATMVSLCGAIIHASGIDSGGFHFYGPSSTGKTTLGQIAASVWGNGAETGQSANSFIKRWNATRNAMENVCASVNDMCLIFDELGSANAKDIGAVSYDISGGQGKLVQDSTRNLRRLRSWSLSIISTGELSLQSKIEEGSTLGKKVTAKGGQKIRIIDIEVKPTMFKSRQQVDALKFACSNYFGSLGPAFIQALVDKYTPEQLQHLVKDSLEKSLVRVIKGRKLSSIQERAIRRFALAEVAGLIVVSLRLIPGLTKQNVETAVDRVINDWMPMSESLSDSARSVAALRDFILKNRELRFKPYKAGIDYSSNNDKLHREIAGYHDSFKDVFYMLPEAFKEAVNAEPKQVAGVLRDLKFLLNDRTDRLTNRITVEHQQITVYAVKGALLEDVDTTDGRKDTPDSKQDTPSV